MQNHGFTAYLFAKTKLLSPFVMKFKSLDTGKKARETQRFEL